MSDASKQERIEEFLRKSLLGDELVNTQFHLFSARSVASSKVVEPRVLCANNALLTKSSKYFLDILSSDIINPSDQKALIEITGDNDVPCSARIDDYGYGSDSDLDADEDSEPPLETAGRDESTIRTPSSLLQPAKQTKGYDGATADGSDSATCDVSMKQQENESIASSETAIEEIQSNTPSVKHASLRLRSLGSRHILVRDTAFQTWYTLLNYFYTGKFNFLPLSSTCTGSHSNSSLTSSLDEPRCSAKSMYRLASKVGLDDLRDEAFSYIRSNLTEHNILQEVSCSLLSRHPSLLEMELDVLYSHIASPPVVAGFPALARRIANGELSHGANIITGIHTRLLKTPQSSVAEPSRPCCLLPKQFVPGQSTEKLAPPGPQATQPSVSSAASVPPSLDSSSAKPALFPFAAASPSAPGSSTVPTPTFPRAAGNSVPPGSSAVKPSIFSQFSFAATTHPSESKPPLFSFAMATPPPGPSVPEPSCSIAAAKPPPNPSVAPLPFPFAAAKPAARPPVSK